MLHVLEAGVERHDRRIELTVVDHAHQGGRALLRPVDGQPGVCAADDRHQVWKQIRPDGWDHAKAQGAREGIGELRCRVLELTGGCQYRTRPTEHYAAGSRHAHAAPAPLEHLHPELLLRQGDLRAQ